MNKNALALSLVQAFRKEPDVVSAYLLGSFLRGKARVVSKGKRIYEASTSDAASFEAFVLHRYFDTAHLRRLFESSLKDRFQASRYAH